VNLSELEVGLVAPEAVTVTATVPVPGGAMAVTEVSDCDVTVAATLPKSTVAPEAPNPEPEMTTDVPPAWGPVLGDKPVT
jgi:hypothetical protein